MVGAGGQKVTNHAGKRVAVIPVHPIRVETMGLAKHSRADGLNVIAKEIMLDIDVNIKMLISK